MTVALNLAYVALVGIWLINASSIILPVPVNVIIHSVLIIYIGCHRSLNLLATEEEGGAALEDREVLSSADGKFLIRISIIFV